MRYVTRRLFAEPTDAVIFPDGRCVVHPVLDSRGLLDCRTPWGKARCRCGAYVIVWEATPPPPEEVT